MFNRNINQPTQHLYLYTSGFSSGLRCTTQYKRPSLEESFIMHSRLGLAGSHAPSHSRHAVCAQCSHGTPQSQHHVMSHSSLALRRQIRFALCDASGDWTSGAGLCRRLVDSWCLLGLRLPVSRGPSLSWDSRRAFRRSPPNEFDNHASRTLRSSVTMYSMLARPRLTSRHRWPSCLIFDGFCLRLSRRSLKFLI